MKTFLCEYIHPAARQALESFSEIVSDLEGLPECDAAINRNLQMTKKFLQSAVCFQHLSSFFQDAAKVIKAKNSQ